MIKMNVKLKHVKELYKLDWKRIFRNKLTLFFIVALMVIPSLYAWFNIAALWDPYANTGDIKIAVYSSDEEVEVMDKKVNVGNKIVKNLRTNDAIGWQFVDSKKELDDGVKSGKYYAGIYLPKDFSENLVSFVNGEIKKPEIEYSVNQKINAIAPKIADKGAGTIQETISKEFIGVVSKTLLKTFNEIGYDLDANLPSINKLTSKILEIDDNLDKIEGYTKEVQDLNKKMPEYKEKLTKANEFIDYLPEVTKMGNKVVQVNNMLPEIRESGKMIVSLQNKIPQIRSAGAQLNAIDNDFDKVTKIMDEAISEANKGLRIMTEAQQVLPQVALVANAANQLIPEVKDNVQKIQDAMPQVASGIGIGAQLIGATASDISRISEDLAQLVNNHELTPEKKADIQSVLAKLATSLETLNRLIDSTTTSLTQLQNITGSNKLQDVIDQLAKAKRMIQPIIQDIYFISNNLDYVSTDVVINRLLTISEQSKRLAETLDGINPQAIQTRVNSMLDKVQTMLTGAQKLTSQIDNQKINDINRLLDSTSQTVTEAIGLLQKYQQQLPAMKQEVHSANVLVNSNMERIVGAINKAAYMYQNDLPNLEQKLSKASSFVINDWPNIEHDLKRTMNMVNEKVPEVEEALTMADDMIQNDWPNIRTGIEKAADGIRKGQKDFDLKEVIKLLKSDVNKETNFIKNPVKIAQKDVYPVPNYGSASTPFYTTLCLWVGALLLSSLATTDVHLRGRQLKRYSKREQFLSRMMTYLTIGFFQTLIVTLGNLWLLDVYVVDSFYSVLFAFIVGLTFMMIVYVLVALFNNLGKGMAIIILVLSISGGGGNFPIQMSGPFFRFINPLLPFTYGVNLLREPVGGIYWPNAKKYIFVLILFTVVFFLLGFILYPYVKDKVKALDEKMHGGRIIH